MNERKKKKEITKRKYVKEKEIKEANRVRSKRRVIYKAFCIRRNEWGIELDSNLWRFDNLACQPLHHPRCLIWLKRIVYLRSICSVLMFSLKLC